MAIIFFEWGYLTPFVEKIKYFDTKLDRNCGLLWPHIHEHFSTQTKVVCMPIHLPIAHQMLLMKLSAKSKLTYVSHSIFTSNYYNEMKQNYYYHDWEKKKLLWEKKVTKGKNMAHQDCFPPPLLTYHTIMTHYCIV